MSTPQQIKPISKYIFCNGDTMTHNRDSKEFIVSHTHEHSVTKYTAVTICKFMSDGTIQLNDGALTIQADHINPKKVIQIDHTLSDGRIVREFPAKNQIIVETKQPGKEFPITQAYFNVTNCRVNADSGVEWDVIHPPSKPPHVPQEASPVAPAVCVSAPIQVPNVIRSAPYKEPNIMCKYWYEKDKNGRMILCRVPAKMKTKLPPWELKKQAEELAQKTPTVTTSNISVGTLSSSTQYTTPIVKPVYISVV